MRPIEYLSKEEKFIYNSVKEDIKKCTNKKQLEILEKTLDELLVRSIKRYRKRKKINERNN